MIARAPEISPGAWDDATHTSRLLGGRVVGVQQSHDGGYGGERRLLVAIDLARHHDGLATFAVFLGVGGRSYGLGVEIDERFPERLRVIAEAIERRGWEPATICTGGSSAERGKVVVFFTQPVPDEILNAEARQILDEARADVRWGIERAKAVDLRPTRPGTSGESGLLRIGGRNADPKRGATGVDRFFSIHGEPKTLADVRPTSWTTRIPNLPQPTGGRQLGRWVAGYVYGTKIRAWPAPSEWAGQKGHGHATVSRAQKRLAHECAEVYGDGKLGEKAFALLWATWKANSPGLDVPTKTSNWRGDVFADRRRDRTWRKALATHRTITVVDGAAGTVSLAFANPTRAGRDTIIPPPVASAPQGLYSVPGSRPRLVLEAFVLLVNARRLNPHTFGLDLGTLASAAGIFTTDRLTGERIPDKGGTRKAVAILEREGLIVRHDPGLRGSAGRGRCALYGLVLDGEAAAAVKAEAGDHHRVLARRDEVARVRRKRAERGAEAAKPSPEGGEVVPLVPTAGEPERPAAIGEAQAEALLAYARAKIALVPLGAKGPEKPPPGAQPEQLVFGVPVPVSRDGDPHGRRR